MFLVRWDDGAFPSRQAVEGRPEDVEDERRLAYVGITRAMRRLAITCVAGEASRFLGEIPEDLTDRVVIPHTPRRPSWKALSYAMDIAEGLGIAAPDDLGENAAVCSAFIDAHVDSWRRARVGGGVP